MAVPSPPRLFVAWRVEAFLFSAVFFFLWHLQVHSVCADFCPYMTKCRVAGKSLKHSAAVHTAPVLVIFILPFGFGKCQPILAQAQHSSEPDMVCHSLLFQPYDVLSSRTFSHERPLAQPGGLFHVQLEHSPSHEDANRDRPEDAQFGLPHQRVLWDHSARDTCFHIPSGGLRCIFWNTRGFFGFTCFLTTVQGTEAYLPHTAKNNHFSSLQEPHGKDSCKLFRYYSLNSCLFWYIHSEQCTCRWACYPHPWQFYFSDMPIDMSSQLQLQFLKLFSRN